MEKLELYKKAKEEYYKGTPIMSDEEFDNLEQELHDSGVLEEYVGAVDREAKFEHPTRMLSLSKFQADKTTGKAPTLEALAWMKNTGEKVFKVTCKYDGNAVNVIYKDGKLFQILTRGDGKRGRDITDKLKKKVPNRVKQEYADGILEVRGEAIMLSEVFDKKYKGTYANPRNLVAGMLGRDEGVNLSDVEFIAYDAKYDGEYLDILVINELGFNKVYKPFERSFILGEDDFDKLFEEMVEVRAKSEFPLDGFVLKVVAENRNKFKENDHDPDWGKAIKFKPEGVVTEVEDIEWSMGKTGEYTPIAILTPVELDGTTVSRACLYNAGYVVDYAIEKGTRVRIVKSGDIIPQIVEVFND